MIRCHFLSLRRDTFVISFCRSIFTLFLLIFSYQAWNLLYLCFGWLSSSFCLICFPSSFEATTPSWKWLIPMIHPKIPSWLSSICWTLLSLVCSYSALSVQITHRKLPQYWCHSLLCNFWIDLIFISSLCPRVFPVPLQI